MARRPRATTGPTRRAHAYGLLKAILATAVADDLLDANPCRIRGASKTKRVRQIRPATLAELRAIADAMPDRWRRRCYSPRGAGCDSGRSPNYAAATSTSNTGGYGCAGPSPTTTAPTTRAAPENGGRQSATWLSPRTYPDAVRRHLLEHAHPGRDGLLFYADNGGHLRTGSAMHDAFHAAREGAGRPDLRFHDLRHTGATLAAAAGATVAELMARIGHTTPAMAMRYQHATADRARGDSGGAIGFPRGGRGALRPAGDARRRTGAGAES